MNQVNKFIIITLSIFAIVSSVSSQEFLPVTISAYAPGGQHFQGHNQYSSLRTFNGNIYVFSMDAIRRPYINKIDENNSSIIETALLDTCESDIYRVFDDGHHRFDIGIDEQGYIHIIGDMHHGNLGSKRDVSIDNPLPERFVGSFGDQMYWISDRPEDISSFSFVGFDTLRHIPCNGLTYTHIEPDLNGKLYMSGRQSVRDPRIHVPGTMGLSLWRYNIEVKSWEELGAIPDDNYGHTGYDAVLPSILWEPHGYGRESVWYQVYSNSLKFDKNNRLHLLGLINANSIYDGSTHVMYAYSDDGGDTFFRRDGSQIASLPIRVTGPEENRGSILMTQGFPDEFDASYYGVFWDRNFNPAFSYSQLQTSKAHYCYYDSESQQSIDADFNISVSNIRSDHYTLHDGSIVFLGTKLIQHAQSFTDPGTIYYMTDPNIPSGDGGYLIREVDIALLRDKNILRGLSEKYGQGIIISMDLNAISTPVSVVDENISEKPIEITTIENQLAISFAQNSLAKIELYNLRGQKVNSLFTGMTTSQMTFDLNELNVPMQYLILRITTPTENISRMILKK